MIEGGLAELRISAGPFLPSIGDFIGMCRRRQLERFGVVPSEGEAFALLQRFMAVRGVKRDFTKLNPVVFATYSRLDWATVSAESTKAQRQAFREAWQHVQRDLLAGRELPKPKMVAPAPVASRIEAQPRSRVDVDRERSNLLTLVAGL